MIDWLFDVDRGLYRLRTLILIPLLASFVLVGLAVRMLEDAVEEVVDSTTLGWMVARYRLVARLSRLVTVLLS